MNRAGSFLYEPAGSVHTLQCVEDDTHVWFQMYGANLNLDADGNVESVIDGAGTLAAYYVLCEAAGPAPPERPRRLSADHERSTSATRRVRRRARRTRSLAELRRTRPGATGRTCRASPGSGRCCSTPTSCTSRAQPMLFSASEGGVVLENLDDAERSR